MPHSPASEDVLVAPGYLAGTTGTEAVAPLLESAPGWTRALVDPDSSYVSSCQRLSATRRTSEWTFTYTAEPLNGPVWSAHFDDTTPDEVLIAFTERLIDGVDAYFADFLRGGPLHTGLTPAGIFAEHGWQPVHGARPWRTQAPDEHAAFQIRSGYVDESEELHDKTAATWKITAGPVPVSQPTWSAHFTGDTPEPLMAAVALAVTDPQPVARPAHRIPIHHRDLVELQPAAHSARASAAQARSRFSTATQPTRETPPPLTPMPTTYRIRKR